MHNITSGRPDILCIEQMKRRPLYGMDDTFQIQGSSEKASSELDECLPFLRFTGMKITGSKNLAGSTKKTLARTAYL